MHNFVAGEIYMIASATTDMFADTTEGGSEGKAGWPQASIRKKGT